MKRQTSSPRRERQSSPGRERQSSPGRERQSSPGREKQLSPGRELLNDRKRNDRRQTKYTDDDEDNFLNYQEQNIRKYNNIYYEEDEEDRIKNIAYKPYDDLINIMNKYYNPNLFIDNKNSELIDNIDKIFTKITDNNIFYIMRDLDKDNEEWKIFLFIYLYETRNLYKEKSIDVLEYILYMNKDYFGYNAYTTVMAIIKKYSRDSEIFRKFLDDWEIDEEIIYEKIDELEVIFKESIYNLIYIGKSEKVSEYVLYNLKELFEKLYDLRGDDYKFDILAKYIIDTYGNKLNLESRNLVFPLTYHTKNKLIDELFSVLERLDNNYK